MMTLTLLNMPNLITPLLKIEKVLVSINASAKIIEANKTLTRNMIFVVTIKMINT